LPAVDAAHAEVFDLEELLDAVFRAPVDYQMGPRRDLASRFGRDDALVDTDDAVFEPLGDPPDAADVTAVEIGGGPLPSLPRERGRVRVGVSLAILTASSSVLKR
jgi:hypothetical protein